MDAAKWLGCNSFSKINKKRKEINLNIQMVGRLVKSKRL
jgi:hypothetical protein